VNEVHSYSRSPMLDTIDKLTEPTACSLLDGTVELALAKVSPSQKACHSVPVHNGYVCCATYLCVGQCESIPSACAN
jgi:hypothetical protein